MGFDGRPDPRNPTVDGGATTDQSGHLAAYRLRRTSIGTMPVNRRYPIADLIAASREYAKQTGRRVSFEYCLIAGENDSEADAHALADLLRDERFPCHVNLIPWNPVDGTGLARSTCDAVNAFKANLDGRGVPCTSRIQRGVDIDAACGQLAGAHRYPPHAEYEWCTAHRGHPTAP